jgi:glycosyltransferase involved in cell wall biosynthesis
LYARKNDERDMAEKIVTLLDDEQTRNNMGQYGRRRVEETLAWEHEAPTLLAAYDLLFQD